MIDTVKIYAEIDKTLYNEIHSKSIVKSSINYLTGELIYEITNGHIVGSYDSRLSVRVGCGAKYGFADNMYCIELEGSYHKLIKGFNSHDGIYNLNFIVNGFIDLVENAYNIKLPCLDNWYLQRIDIAKCYDLSSQENVIQYLNSLGMCSYPKRKVNTFSYGGLNIPGTSSTLKVYNKFLEFNKHDKIKFKDKDFNLDKYLNHIKGFVRFEVEIKKKLLKKMYYEKKDDIFIKYGRVHIKVKNLNYKDFENVWSDEFMKLLGIIEKEIELINDKNAIKERLIYLYGCTSGMRLYNFYSSIQLDGIDFVKSSMNKATFYRNIKKLKEARIDYSQTYKLERIEKYNFNPFEYEEVI